LLLEKGGLIRKFVPHGTHDGLASAVCVPEQSVEVW
jgi:hypothetical protein